MSKLWLQNGKVVIDSTGRPILCDVCPCPTKCEDMLEYLNTLYATYGGTLHGEGFLRRTTEGDDIIIIGQAALVYTVEGVAMIAVVGCGEGDECVWTNQPLVAETDTWFDVSGVCACPGLVTMRMTAEANGYTYYQEGFYSPLRERHAGDTAYNWATRTLYKGAYWDGVKWVVMECDCDVVNVTPPSGKPPNYYKFFEYAGACACLDVRRAVVENAADFGVVDWKLGPDWILSAGGTRYRVSTSQEYRDLDAFSFIEDDGNGYTRFICLGTSVTASPGWAMGSYEYIEEAPMWVEYVAQPNLSVYGNVRMLALITNNSAWRNFYELQDAVNFSLEDPDMTQLADLLSYHSNYDLVSEAFVSQFAPLLPGAVELVRVENSAVDDATYPYRAKKDYYAPDGSANLARNFVVVYAHQWICTSAGVKIRGDWDALWAPDDIAAMYDTSVGLAPNSTWPIETPCDPAASPGCPGDDGSWKEEIE